MHLLSRACTVFSGVTFTVVSSIALQPNVLQRSAGLLKQDPTTDSLPTELVTESAGPCATPTIYCGDVVITEGICEEDVFVQTPQIEFGVNQHGSFGTLVCPADSLGLHANACGNGAGLGIVSSNGEKEFGDEYSGDFFVPGVPYEGWQVRVRNGTGVVMDLEGSLKDSSIHGEGTLSVSGDTVFFNVVHGGLNVTLSYKVHWNCTGISMHTMITPTVAFDPTYSLYFARSVVPDMGQPWGEDFGTDQVVESPNKGINGPYSVITASTKQGRSMSLLSCDPRAHAGIGGFGFMYDLPTYIGMSKEPEWLHMTAKDSDQDIWIIWKDTIPAMGESFEFDGEYFTRVVPRDERDRTFCAQPVAPPSEAPGNESVEPGSEPLPSEEPTTTTEAPPVATAPRPASRRTRPPRPLVPLPATIKTAPPRPAVPYPEARTKHPPLLESEDPELKRRAPAEPQKPEFVLFSIRLALLDPLPMPELDSNLPPL